MTTIKLDTNGDLAIENGSFVLLSDLVAETSQRLQIKFRFFLGEWSLDPRVGFPLFEKILVKAPDLGEIRRLIRETLLGDPAVDSIATLDLDFDRASRTLSVSFECELNDGSSLTFDDFILAENL